MQQDEMNKMEAIHNELDPFSLFRLTSTSKKTFISFPKAWSEFHSRKIKLASSKNIFKKALKKFFISSSSDNVAHKYLFLPTLLTYSNHHFFLGGGGISLLLLL
jgi:hypothetical protein